MTSLSKNFKRSEFACKCGCGFDTVDVELLNALQHCVDRLTTSSKKEITVSINCGCRCKKHNDKLREEYKSTNGKSGENTALNSMHIYGRASDTQFFEDEKKINPQIIYDFFDINYPHFGLGNYPRFTHIDCRSTGKARW